VPLAGLPAAAIAKFRESLSGIVSPEALDHDRFGIAVSGGPDSLALLALSAAALPGRIIAATVDHGLRVESAAEANAVAALCARFSVPHHIIELDWPCPPDRNRQALSREARYYRLGTWALDLGVKYVATAHHLDDQAETLMMRLHRGAGVAGLAGVRIRRLLIKRHEQSVDLVRPLLYWRRRDLQAVIDACGIEPIDDPSNHDPRYDRTRARAFLEASPEWPSRTRMAESARYLGEADRALEWTAHYFFRERNGWDGEAYNLRVTDLPPELQRRVMLETIGMMVDREPDGPTLTRALDELRKGAVITLCEVVVRPSEEVWRFEWAPPRRS
jgi:tRNA(Ile)-lysidine synthase